MHLDTQFVAENKVYKREKFYMKRFISITIAVLLALSMFWSCGKKSSTKFDGNADTLSYIVGLNVAHALMEMDSIGGTPTLSCGISRQGRR